MYAQIFRAAGSPLSYEEVPEPELGKSDALIKVEACAVCRTDLHVVDGDLKSPKLPLIPGHEVVGTVVEIARGADNLNPSIKVGDRVGIPWLAGACMTCPFCLSDRENLCDKPVFTGYLRDGGYGQYACADLRFLVKIPEIYTSVEASPLLCAGLIGYRSYKFAREALQYGNVLGIYGFGAAAHICAQIALRENRKVYAFVRRGDSDAASFAEELGCKALFSDQDAPEPLDAALIFAPAGELVPQSLRSLKKGGTTVLGGIHMSDIPSFPYSILWGERKIQSVANLTRADATEFMELARTKINVSTRTYELEAASQALEDLRSGKLRGAAVLLP